MKQCIKTNGVLFFFCLISLIITAQEQSVQSNIKCLNYPSSFELLLRHFKGKIVYIDVMASWCKPCLAELKEYEKAKTIFLQLLENYPNRMRLFLCIAYCDVYLGNKIQSLDYLKKIKIGGDPTYQRDDEIWEFDIFNAYYVLDEYKLFLEECEKAKSSCDLNYGPYYFGLWTMNLHDQFYLEVIKQRTEILACIEDVKIDDDFASEEERQEYLQCWEDDLESLNILEHKIKYENYKPVVELKLWPIYDCYLID